MKMRNKVIISTMIVGAQMNASGCSIFNICNDNKEIKKVKEIKMSAVLDDKNPVCLTLDPMDTFSKIKTEVSRKWGGDPDSFEIYDVNGNTMVKDSALNNCYLKVLIGESGCIKLRTVKK